MRRASSSSINNNKSGWLRRSRGLASQSQQWGVAVIAPSVSTSMMARQLLANMHVVEVGFRHADQVLVVVRSSLFNPLRPGYNTVGDLQKDADLQLNIAGPNFHVYAYTMDDNLHVTQTAHQSFPTNQ